MNKNQWTRIKNSSKTCDAQDINKKATVFSGKWLVQCGEKAAWILRGRCGCGACDMTVRYCDKHQQEDVKNKNKFHNLKLKRESLPGGLVRYMRVRSKGKE